MTSHERPSARGEYSRASGADRRYPSERYAQPERRPNPARRSDAHPAPHTADGRSSRVPSSGGRREPTPRKRPPARHRSPAARQRMFKRFLPLMVCLLIALGFGVHRLYLMIAVGEFHPTYVANVSIYGVSLSGCTKDEGAALISAMEEEWKTEEFVFTYRDRSWTFTRSMIDADMECDTKLDQAWNLGHIGSLSERKRQIDALARTPLNLTPTITYDEAKLEAFADEICNTLYIAPVDAVVVPDVTKPVVVSESSTGQQVDREQLVSQLVSLVETDEYNTTIPVETLFPEVQSDEVSFQKIAEFQTRTDFRNAASRSNVALALDAFNGMVVQPGETCSFNEIVGPRTEARGFRKATEYAGDKTTEGVGGGVCQASTTLYDALIQAGITVLERSHHNMTVIYVDPSQDAAVQMAPNEKDLLFKNETDYPIYIYTSVDKEYATVTIYGHRPEYRYVLESVIIEQGTQDGRKVAVQDTSGTHVYYTDDPPVLISQGKPNCTSEGWVVAYDWNTGEEVSRVMVSRDTYKPGASTYWVGVHDRAAEAMNVGTITDY